MIIFVASIEHRHGSNFYAATNEDFLDKQIADYVRGEWNKEKLEGDPPVSDGEAIKKYFEFMDSRGEYLVRGMTNLALEEPKVSDPSLSCSSEPTCPYCGSNDVFIDAVANWDASISDWSLSGTQDTMSCQTCDKEFETAKWVDVKPKNETAE